MIRRHLDVTGSHSRPSTIHFMPVSFQENHRRQAYHHTEDKKDTTHAPKI
jgi:hypothetical protein